MYTYAHICIYAHTGVYTHIQKPFLCNLGLYVVRGAALAGKQEALSKLLTLGFLLHTGIKKCCRGILAKKLPNHVLVC